MRSTMIGPTLAVRHHRERVDGRGYRDGLAGEAIPFLSRNSHLRFVRRHGADARLPPDQVHREIVRELHQLAGQRHHPYIIARFEEIIDQSRFRMD